MANWAQDLLGSGGYVVLALLILVENLFPPIPSEVILPLAGSRVSSGDWSYPLAVVAATIGSVSGALALYAIGRLGGRPLLLRYHRVLRLDEAKLDRADAWFDTHGPKVVLLGRLIPGVRSLVSIPAGLSEMPVATFVVLTTIGSLAWNAALIGGGWALGTQWDRVTVLIEAVQYPLLAAIVAAIALLALRTRSRRRARPAAG